MSLTPDAVARAKEIAAALRVVRIKHGGASIATKIDDEMARAVRPFLDAARKETWEAAAKEIPTTWLDPLLSGDKSVLLNGPWDCHDIEVLLEAVRARLRARADALREGDSKNATS